MIGIEEFNVLFNKLIANPWEYFPEKTRIELTRKLYFDKLKGYSFNQVDMAFDNFLRGENKYMPTISRIITNIEAGIESKAFKPFKPLTSLDNRIHRLFRRLVRQSRFIIEKYGNDKNRLRRIGMRYEKIKWKMIA